MTKKRAIVSYDKLSIEQKKQLLVAFPDGFSSGMTSIKTPAGETLDALLWETEEIIYLVKIPKPKAKVVEDDDDDFDDLPKLDDVKSDDDDDFDDKEEDDDYDVADEDDGEDDEE